jgi:hypothetical protein
MGHIRAEAEPNLLGSLLDACIDAAAADGLLCKGLLLLEAALEAGVATVQGANTLLSAMASGVLRGLELGLEVLTRAPPAGPAPDQRACESLISACALVAGGGGSLLTALTALDRCTRAGLPARDLALAEVVLAAASAAPRALEIGLDALRLAGETGLRDMAAAITQLVEACCAVAAGRGALQLGLGLMQQMAAAGLPPPPPAASALIEACAFSGDASGALTLAVTVAQRLRAAQTCLPPATASALVETFGVVAATGGALGRGLELVEAAAAAAAKAAETAGMCVPRAVSESPAAMTGGSGEATREACVDRQACSSLVLACSRCLAASVFTSISARINPTYGRSL